MPRSRKDVQKIVLPSELKIKGESWKIQYVSKMAEDSDGGETEFPLRVITIGADMPPRQFLDTFLHEVFHACCFENGSLNQSMSADHEHFVIDAIANYMSKDPSLWRDLFGLFAKKNV